MGASAPECTDCGACCHSDDPRWIRVFEADAARMTEADRKLTFVDEVGRHMRFDGSPTGRRCVALQVDETGARCQIYPRRPDACRWLQRDSGLCHELIQLRTGPSYG